MHSKVVSRVSWAEGLNELTRFLYYWHHTYKERVERDGTYTLSDVKWQGLKGTPTWHITSNTTTNEVRLMFACKGRTGRRTWLGIGRELGNPSTTLSDAVTSESNIRIVKDMWRDEQRRFVEGKLLDVIHEEGFVPGVVRHVPSTRQFKKLAVYHPKAGSRVKDQVILVSTGLRLSICESVLEFLKVMFDLVETVVGSLAHEQVLKRGVPHRDLSWYNVLCKPEYFIATREDDNHPTVPKHLNVGVDPSKYPTISELLDKHGGVKHPLCLLTDFDNACETTEYLPTGITERTGTSMFMACELAYGVDAYDRFESVPAISLEQLRQEGEALEAYVRVYGQERYNEYDKNLQDFLSGIKDSEAVHPFAAGDFTLSHRPHHDIESVYWIILWFLIKAWPAGLNLNLDIKRRHSHDSLRSVMLNRGNDPDGHLACGMLKYLESDWKSSLHHVYQPLIKMLVSMGRYLCMRWSRFPEISAVHCHEAIKRLLFKEIFRMTNEDKPIPVQGPRPPPLTLTDGPAGEKCSSGASRQSRGSQKRRSSTLANCGPPCKKQRHRREITPREIASEENKHEKDGEVVLKESEPDETAIEELDTEGDAVEANTSAENPLIDKFRENLTNDAKWFL